MSDTASEPIADPTQSGPGPLDYSPRAAAWARRRASFADVARSVRADRLALGGLVVLAAFVVMAVAAPLISPRSGLSAVDSIDNLAWARPSWEFPLGTDHCRPDVRSIPAASLRSTSARRSMSDYGP